MSETPRQRVQAELIRQSDEILAGVKPDEDSGRIAVVSAKFAMGLAEELEAMTAERDAALNERNHFVGCLQGAREAEQTMHENRNTLMRKLQAMTARAELAERQVEEVWRVQVRNYGNATGTHLDLLAWANKSRAEAVKDGGKG